MARTGRIKKLLLILLLCSTCFGETGGFKRHGCTCRSTESMLGYSHGSGTKNLGGDSPQSLCPTCLGVSLSIESFTTGQITPLLESRTDFEKYDSGYRTLENVFVYPQGPVTRRPGTRFIIEPVCAEGNYPTLQVADGAFATTIADPGLTHTTAITTLADLNDIRNDLDGNYYLTGNIDASATSGWNGGLGFEPIGGGFTGTLDGCEYTISGLYINRPTEGTVGLFNQLRDGAKIANLILSNVNIIGESRVGALAGSGWTGSDSYILIQNCHTSGTVALSGNSVYDIGGLISSIYAADGYEYCRIYDCSSSCTIDGETHVTDASWGFAGGLISQVSSCVIRNCSATGEVKGGTGGSTLGGFAGHIDDNVTVTDCSATGAVSGDTYVGGFVGQIDWNCTLERCSARGDCAASVGPVAGFATLIDAVGSFEPEKQNVLSDCYGWGDAIASGAGAAGGFAVSQYGICSRCYSVGVVSSPVNSDPELGKNDGGFNYESVVGGVTPDGSATDCYWDTEASGASTSDGGTGHVTSWMQTKSNYEDAGWNFGSVWEMLGVRASWPSVRLISFEDSTDDAYVLALGENVMGFFRTTE